MFAHRYILLLIPSYICHSDLHSFPSRRSSGLSSFSLATASRFRAARHFPIAAHPHPSFRTERADFSSAFAPTSTSHHGTRNIASSFPAPAPSTEIALMLWLVIKRANAYLFV